MTMSCLSVVELVAVAEVVVVAVVVLEGFAAQFEIAVAVAAAGKTGPGNP